MPAGRIPYALRRYVLRTDLVPKARAKAGHLARQALREPWADVEHLLLAPPAVVIDVGAHIGLVTEAAHRRWPSARIIACEPTPDSFAALAERAASLPGVECVPVALSDAVGTARLRVDPTTDAGASNSLLDHSDEFRLRVSAERYTEVEVPTTTLDELCRERGIDRVDVLKVDVEGAEDRVLAGARGLLAASQIDVVVAEVRLVPGYEGAPLAQDLMAQMADVGYTTFGLYSFAESDIRQGLWGDAVFLGPDLRRRLVAAHGAKACGFTAELP